MNKKGFTLMELLLVVAVLAIVAAAAAPTFFGGAQEAMDEARKSSFMSAYQNCISGANLLMGISASKGIKPEANAVLSFKESETVTKYLKDYAPLAARVCTNKSNATYVFTAYYNGTDVDVYCEVGDGSAEPTTKANKIDVATKKTVEAALLDVWNNINTAATPAS